MNLTGITFLVSIVDRFKFGQTLAKAFKKLEKPNSARINKMIDRIDTQPTSRDSKDFDQRSGKDRREMHTMLDPDRDKRKKNRRKMSHRGTAKHS